jgi:hypothetical protein
MGLRGLKPVEGLMYYVTRNLHITETVRAWKLRRLG